MKRFMVLGAGVLAGGMLLVVVAVGRTRPDGSDVSAGGGWLEPDSGGANPALQPGPSGGRVDAPPASDKFSIQAEGFKPGADIPRKFSCQGADASPALAWTEPPPGTQSFALIADDPDAPAGTWVHWVLYDLPPRSRRLAESVPPKEEITGGGRQGINDFGKIGYGGPCPPPGKPHRYFFRLYALDSRLNLKAGASRSDLDQAMKGRVLASTEVMGRYGR